MSEPYNRRRHNKPLQMSETELKYLYLAVAKLYSPSDGGASAALWKKFNQWDPELLRVGLEDRHKKEVEYG